MTKPPDEQAVDDLLEEEDQLQAVRLGPISPRLGGEAAVSRHTGILQAPSFGGARTSMSSFGPGTLPSAS